MSDSGKTRREINYWLNRLEQSVVDVEAKPWRSDNEIITKLFESVENHVTREVIDSLYERHLSGDTSPDVVGIAFLADAYAMKDYSRIMREWRASRRKVINAAKERIKEQKAKRKRKGKASGRKLLSRTLGRTIKKAEKIWQASEAVKLCEDPRWIYARSVWVHRQPRQSIIDGVRFLLDVQGEADDPWISVQLGDLSLHRKTVKAHADDPTRPYIHRPERGNYEIKRSKLRDYLSSRLWEKFGV